MDNRERFEDWWAKNSDDNNNTKVAAMEAWETCAEQKDKEIDRLTREILVLSVDTEKEIAGLQKQVNALKMSNDARNKLIDWCVTEGVAIRTKELQAEIQQLDSEREANQLLTNEIAELKDLLTKALDERDHFYKLELARQALIRNSVNV